MDVFKKHINKQKKISKSKVISTVNDKHTLFNSLNPISQRWEEGEFKALNGQTNTKDRIREVITDINAAEMEKLM